jgi:hypothetical protein
MNGKRLLTRTLALTAALCLASGARAQYLDVTLSESTAVVTQGTTTVDFFATISNTTGSTVFLNGDQFSISAPLLGLDDSPFNNNAPLSLNAGQSTGPFELFDVSLSASTALGTYGGNVFSILGGANGGSVTDLADTTFSVTVQAPSGTSVPEIDPRWSFGALTLLAGCVAILRDRRVVRVRG